METLGIVIGIVMLVLNLIGIIWLGIAIGHWFWTLVAYGVILGITFNIKKGYPGIIVLGIGALITLVVIIVCIVKAVNEIKSGKQQKELNNTLLNSVKEGNKQTVQELIEKGGNVNYIGYVSSDKKSLLEIAVENNDKEMVSLLIEKGANVNLENGGITPLDCTENEEMIALLRRHGAKTKKELDEEAEEAFLASEIFYNAQDYKKTVECLEKAVSLGHIGAHNDLAIHYMRGLGVEEDWNKVYELSKVAAEAGIANSQVNLGYCYAKGKGTYQSDSSAIYWYEKAAEQGNDLAMHNLGLHYYGKRDAINAKLWLEKAIELGNVNAMFDLGDCYRYLLLSAREAGKWYEKAARNGHVEALAALKELCGMGLYNVGDDY